MTRSRYERTFEDSGKTFAALLNEQDDGRFSVTVRLPDDSLRTVPGEHFASADAAMVAAPAFAHELVPADAGLHLWALGRSGWQSGMAGGAQLPHTTAASRRQARARRSNRR